MRNANGQLSPLTILSTAAGALIMLLIGLVGWLFGNMLNRIAVQADSTEKIVWQLRQDVAVMGSKVDTISAKQDKRGN
jgi:hypothetical protein